MDQSHSNTIETSRKLGKHLTLDERGDDSGTAPARIFST